MGTSNMPLDPWCGVLLVTGSGVDVVDIFILKTGVPPATLELSTELVAMVVRSPCGSLESPGDSVVMVTGGPLDLEITVVATEGSLVSLELVVMATGGALVPLKVSREVTVTAPSVTGLAVVVGGSLETAAHSGSGTDVLETSREVAGSGTEVFRLSPAGSPRVDDSVVPKRGGEGGCGV